MAAVQDVLFLVVVCLTAMVLAYPRNYDYQYRDSLMAAMKEKEMQNGDYYDDQDYGYDEMNQIYRGRPRFDGYEMNYDNEHGIGEPTGEVEMESNWPKVAPKIGQVGGIATCPEGHPHIFHRADRPWAADIFDAHNTYTKVEEGPIKQTTLWMLNKTDGALKKQWGADMFYLPHGLTLDHEANYWLTDVAMHQVFKFKEGDKEPLLTIGKKFEPATNNTDPDRLCKPTDVAVDSQSGDFFVADGYCNSRILKYNKDGELQKQFGDGVFDIPHSLALAEDLDLICVADREHKRVVCFDAGRKNPEALGELKQTLVDPEFGRVFGIDYDITTGFLYAVTGPSTLDGEELPPMLVTIDLRGDRYFSDFISYWPIDDEEMQTLKNPHDVAVSPDGKNLYVGEISPNKIWKFDQMID